MTKKLQAGPYQSGQRLDRVISDMLGFSLRGGRRLIGDGNVRVNGKVASKGQKIAAGDIIEAETENRPVGLLPSFLASQGNYYFFYKPAGIHTVALAGRNDASLEQFLPQLAGSCNLPEDLVLLQRLDLGTSGLVCAALGEPAVASYRLAEKAGDLNKYYFALLEGTLTSSLCLRNRLDTNGGKRVRILEEEASETGWTRLEPVWQGEFEARGPVTLAKCRLHAGQRHQIRAHASKAGYPLSGDRLYGSSWKGPFLLEHNGLEFPGHRFFYNNPGSGLAQLLNFAGTGEQG